MRTLALDLGTRTGWAVFDNGHLIASGTWTLQNDRQRRFEGAGVKWLRLRRLLDEMTDIEHVAIEEVRRHMGVDAAHAYGGALAVVTAWCEAMQVPYESYPVASIKKHATGKGNAKKDAMMAAATARWPGVQLEDDNQADAMWLGDLAQGRSVEGGGA